MQFIRQIAKSVEILSSMFSLTTLIYLKLASWCVIKRMNNIMHVCEQSNASMYWNWEP